MIMIELCAKDLNFLYFIAVVFMARGACMTFQFLLMPSRNHVPEAPNSYIGASCRAAPC